MYLSILIKALEFYRDYVDHDDYESDAIEEALDELGCQRTQMYCKNWSKRVHIVTKEGLEDMFDEHAYDIFGKVARECLNDHKRPSYVSFGHALRKESDMLSHVNACAASVGFKYLENKWWDMERMGCNLPDGTYDKEV